MTELKNSIDSFNSNQTEQKEELEDRAPEIILSDEQKSKGNKKAHRI